MKNTITHRLLLLRFIHATLSRIAEGEKPPDTGSICDLVGAACRARYGGGYDAPIWYEEVHREMIFFVEAVAGVFRG